jgi:phenylalanyl-tRNA synthetase beta subunit
MAYAFYFQASDRTLTEKEVEGEISSLVQWLGDELQATQRS